MLNHNELDEALDWSDPKARKVLKDFFKAVPDAVLPAIRVVSFDKDETIIKLDDVGGNVYIILKGVVIGEDLLSSGIAYQFMEYRSPSIIGDYEAIGNAKRNIISLTVSEPVIALEIEADAYVRWLKNDNNALWIRCQLFVKTITSESGIERKHKFLNCHDSLLLYLDDHYEKTSAFVLNRTQVHLAKRLGVTVRTIQRNIMKLEEEHFLSVKHGKITITPEQYERIHSVTENYLLENKGENENE